MLVTRLINRTANGTLGRPRRLGAALVEFAVVSPLLFMTVLGMTELGRAVMTGQLAVAAAREGARKAAVRGATTDTVTTAVKDFLANCGVGSTAVSVAFEQETANGSGTYSSVAALSSVPSGREIRITVTVDFSKVTWVPSTATYRFMPSTLNLVGVTTITKES